MVSKSSTSTVADNPTAIVNFVLQTALQKINAGWSTSLPVGGANNVIRYNLLEQGGGNQQACQGEEEEDEEKEMLTDIKDELLAESESSELDRNPFDLAEHPGLGAGVKGLSETRTLPEDEEEVKGKGNGFPPVSSSLCARHCVLPLIGIGLPEISPLCVAQLVFLFVVMPRSVFLKHLLSLCWLALCCYPPPVGDVIRLFVIVTCYPSIVLLVRLWRKGVA